MTTREAFAELLNHPQVYTGEPIYQEKSYTPEPIRPLHERSQIYLEMLSMLHLEEKHYCNLLERGLSDTIIRGNMYRSIPTDWKKRQDMVRRLSARFDLAGILGFYTKNLHWDMANCRYSGILIPICSKDSQIQGLQIRLDEPPPRIITKPDGSKIEKKGDRFRWFSTGGMSNGKKYYENGTGISSYIHVVGDLNSDTLHITEGAMKADIASFLSDGELFIGLTGVQNVRYLEQVVKELHPKRILECIDMDVRSNPHVQKAQSKIRSICVPLCEEYRPFTWPVEQKGIDYWLLFEKLKAQYCQSIAA